MNLYWTREELKKWSFFIFIGTVLVYSARSALPVVSGICLSKLSKHVRCGQKWFIHDFKPVKRFKSETKKDINLIFWQKIDLNRDPHSGLGQKMDNKIKDWEAKKKFWSEMNLVGIIMNLEKLWGALVMDTWWVRLLVAFWLISLVVQL